MCAAVSLFLNTTSPPASIVTVAGIKQSGSQPGVDEPAAFSTTAFAWSPYALGAAAAIEAIAKRTNNEPIVFVFIKILTA